MLNDFPNINEDMRDAITLALVHGVVSSVSASLLANGTELGRHGVAIANAVISALQTISGATPTAEPPSDNGSGTSA